MRFGVGDEFGRKSEIRNPMVEFAFPLENAGLVRIAMLGRRFNERVEHSLQVESRAADHLKHIGGRGLLLQRLSDLARARLHLGLQGLIALLDLGGHMVEAVRERFDLIAAADRDALAELAFAELLGTLLQAPDWHHHAPGEHRAGDRGEQKAETQQGSGLREGGIDRCQRFT